MGRIWDHNFNACPGKRVQMQALIGVKMFGRGKGVCDEWR